MISAETITINGKELIHTYSDTGVFTLIQMADVTIPEYPAEALETGKTYELMLEGETFAWKIVDRPLTESEKIAVLTSLTDEQSAAVTVLFDPWLLKVYQANDKVRYSDKLYKCVQAHTAQSDWTPDITPALWTMISVEEWPEWVQPLGAQDAYTLGAKATHNSKRWTSTIDDNVWEPGVYGWKEI